MTSKYHDISVPYSAGELEGLREAFRRAPTYKNGYISTADYPRVLEEGMRLERTPEQLQAYVEYYDKHEGGRIGLEQLIAEAQAVYSTVLYLEDKIRKADKDGSGTISADEFQDVLQLLTVHDPAKAGITFEDFVLEADLNENGIVSVEECVSWIKSHVK